MSLTKHMKSEPARDGQRLQKVLAAAGLGSRRQCEELILAGRVEVDRQVVTELGTRVATGRQTVQVDGVTLKAPKRFYYLVNKPPGVLSTARDQWRRTRVIDLIKSDERLFTVGRLDKSSVGLILVTNDGELANRLAHPRYGIEKTYLATVTGHPSTETLAKLRRGTFLAEGPVRPVSVRVKRRLKQGATLEIVLREGRNREIRRMLARVGHKVMQLRRVALGPLRLGDLPVGSYREVTRDELRSLRKMTRDTPRGQVSRGTRRKTRGVASKSERARDPGKSRRRGTVLGGFEQADSTKTVRKRRGHNAKATSPKRRVKGDRG